MRIRRSRLASVGDRLFERGLRLPRGVDPPVAFLIHLEPHDRRYLALAGKEVEKPTNPLGCVLTGPRPFDAAGLADDDGMLAVQRAQLIKALAEDVIRVLPGVTLTVAPVVAVEAHYVHCVCPGVSRRHLTRTLVWRIRAPHERHVARAGLREPAADVIPRSDEICGRIAVHSYRPRVVVGVHLVSEAQQQRLAPRREIACPGVEPVV